MIVVNTIGLTRVSAMQSARYEAATCDVCLPEALVQLINDCLF